MNIDEIMRLAPGTEIVYTCENVTEHRIIGRILGKLAAISTNGTHMPLNKETYEKHKYQIKKS